MPLGHSLHREWIIRSLAQAALAVSAIPTPASIQSVAEFGARDPGCEKCWRPLAQPPKKLAPTAQQLNHSELISPTTGRPAPTDLALLFVVPPWTTTTTTTMATNGKPPACHVSVVD